MKVSFIGLGNVGRGTLEILADNGARIARKLGGPLAVKAICSRSISRLRMIFPVRKSQVFSLPTAFSQV